MAIFLQKNTVRRAFGALCVGAFLTISNAAFAQMTPQAVDAYAKNMQSAMSARNINQVARLLSDDVVISLTRQGSATATLDKSAYLNALQKGWSGVQNYKYTFTLDNVVITDDTARVQSTINESYTKDGQATTITANSRSTLGLNGNNAVLLRAVVQVSVR